MSDQNNYDQAPVLLTLKGQVVIHYLDGRILEGEFITQDMFNLFLQIDDEPVMIPRNQVRFIKGATGQSIEADDSQAAYVTNQDGEIRTSVSTIKSRPVKREEIGTGSIWDTDVTDAEENILSPTIESERKADPYATEVLEREEVTAVPPNADDQLGDDETMLIDVEDDEDETIFIEEDDDEDSTMVFDESGDSTPLITAYFECTAGPHAGQRFELQPGVTTIGRSSDNIFALSSDKEVSRRHSLINQQADGTFVIEDRGSLNGVIINDIRIEAPYTLHENDEVLIGQCVMIYHE